MTIRDLYADLIRRHPLRFRSQFESEMLATFDDAARESSSIVLLGDAAVSLVRQWVLRANALSRNWKSPLPAGADLLTFLQLQSEEALCVTWRWNLVFMTASVAAIFILPAPTRTQWLGNALVLFYVETEVYRRHRSGLADKSQEFSAVSIAPAPRRQLLIRKRDSLRLFAGGGSPSWTRSYGPLTVLMLLMWCMFVLRFLAWKHSGPGSWLSWSRDPALQFSIAGTASVGVAIGWFFIRQLNLRAAAALQQEIDALDRSEPRPQDQG